MLKTFLMNLTSFFLGVNVLSLIQDGGSSIMKWMGVTGSIMALTCFVILGKIDDRK